jgi:uncharacterized protein YegP (UPF0339 family)
MKKYKFLIKDAKRGQFRVCQVGPNGEMINQSQPLDSLDNVYKNILASVRVSNQTNEIRKSGDFRNENQRLIYICKLAAIDKKIWVDYNGRNKTLLASFG